MAAAIDYLAHLPAAHAVSLTVLGALTPAFLMVLGGFAWAHWSDVREGR